jgi:hypothetical protein
VENVSRTCPLSCTRYTRRAVLRHGQSTRSIAPFWIILELRVYVLQRRSSPPPHTHTPCSLRQCVHGREWGVKGGRLDTFCSLLLPSSYDQRAARLCLPSCRCVGVHEGGSDQLAHWLCACTIVIFGQVLIRFVSTTLYPKHHVDPPPPPTHTHHQHACPAQQQPAHDLLGVAGRWVQGLSQNRSSSL